MDVLLSEDLPMSLNQFMCIVTRQRIDLGADAFNWYWGSFSQVRLALTTKVCQPLL